MRFATVRLVLMAAALTACAVEHEAAPPDDGVEAHAEQSNELDLREIWLQYGKLDLRAPWQRSCDPDTPAKVPTHYFVRLASGSCSTIAAKGGSWAAVGTVFVGDPAKDKRCLYEWSSSQPQDADALESRAAKQQGEPMVSAACRVAGKAAMDMAHPKNGGMMAGCPKCAVARKNVVFVLPGGLPKNQTLRLDGEGTKIVEFTVQKHMPAVAVEVPGGTTDALGTDAVSAVGIMPP